MTAAAATITPRGVIVDLDVDLIDVGANVRVDPGELEGLAASIRAHGLAQPIKAIGPHADGRYRLVYGQRRLLATKQAGLATVTAIVEPTSDVDEPGPRRSIVQLIENLQRADLNPIDEAKALRAVLDADKKLTQVALADELGRSQQWIAGMLRLLETADGVQAHLQAGELTAAHGKAIAAVEVALQPAFAKRVVEGGWSAHETERQAKVEVQLAAGKLKQKATNERHAAQAIELLGKVAAKDAVIIGAYDAVADLVRAAGWTDIRANFWNFDVVDQAGACGCKAWRVIVPYDDKGEVKIAPLCVDEKHREDRSKARSARSSEADRAHAAEREQRQAEHEAARAEAFRQGSVVASFIGKDPASPVAQRLILRALQMDLYEGDFVERILGEEVASNLDAFADPVWLAVSELTDEGVTRELGAAIGASLVGDTDGPAGEALRATLAEAVPGFAPEPEPALEAPTVQSEAAERVKGKRAARVAAAAAPAAVMASALDDASDAVEMAMKAAR